MASVANLGETQTWHTVSSTRVVTSAFDFFERAQKSDSPLVKKAAASVGVSLSLTRSVLDFALARSKFPSLYNKTPQFAAVFFF